MEETKHNINIVENGATTITKVKNVPAFSATEMDIMLESERLKVTGEGLEIAKLDLDTGTLVVTGKVKSVTYHNGEAKAKLMRRIFK